MGYLEDIQSKRKSKVEDLQKQSFVDALVKVSEDVRELIGSLEASGAKKLDKRVVESISELSSGQYLKGNGTSGITSESAATLAATVGSLLFPVGALYTATVSTNPGTLLGFGTWSAYGEGRVLVGKASSGTFQTAGSTGGAETVTLTTSEIPAHKHGIDGIGFTGFDSNGGAQIPTTNTNLGSARITETGVPAGTTDGGSGGAHNNLQPYVVVYIWQRTA